MAYSKTYARKLAGQIHSRFGSKIASVTAGTPIPPEFIAGLIGVEAGKDRKGNIVETATRFEPHVFAKLKDVRDGRLRQYNNIKRLNLSGASDAALKALATSFGITQIMGWWTVHLGGTVAQLRDPKTHLDYTVKLLMLNGKGGDFERKEYAGEFREWNTGSEKGKTYHANYVANAGAVMEAYRELATVEREPFAASLVTDPEPSQETSTPEVTDVETMQAIPPLPVSVPGWIKKAVGWGSGLSFGGLGASFAALRDDPVALMGVLNILKWGFLALGFVVGVVVAGVIVMRMQNARLANDLNIARLRNFADPDTKNVDFSGWKAAPDKTEVKL